MSDLLNSLPPDPSSTLPVGDHQDPDGLVQEIERLVAQVWDERVKPDRQRAQAAADLEDSMAATPPEFALAPADIKRLYEALFWQGADRTAESLTATIAVRGSAPDKFEVLVDMLATSAWITRATFDREHAVQSLGSHVESDYNSIVGTVIDRLARADVDDRMVSLLAALVETLAGDRTEAIRLVERCAADRNVPPASLLGLRIEIGGHAAIQPLVKQLEHDTKRQLAHLRAKSEHDWTTATRAATFGFHVRVGMTILVFLIGMGITIAAVVQAIGADSGESVLGPGVTLAAGLGAMLAVVYRGPLIDVNDSVSDLSQISVAYMTFMHRLQFVTQHAATEHAYGKLDQTELEQTTHALQTAAVDYNRTIAQVRTERSKRARRKADG
jgi:hypothetical protein